mgnify:FL=1
MWREFGCVVRCRVKTWRGTDDGLLRDGEVIRRCRSCAMATSSRKREKRASYRFWRLRGACAMENAWSVASSNRMHVCHCMWRSWCSRKRRWCRLERGRGVSVGSVLRASHRFQETVHDGVHVPRTVRGRGFWVLHSQVLQWRFVIYLFDCLLDKRRSGIAVNGMGSGEMMKG